MKQIKLFFLLFTLMLSVSANAVIQEGSCGDNVTFVLNDDGTLVISGSGAMKDYFGYYSVPWYSNRTKIIKATIEDGVTSIGNRAFYDCSGLTSVTIPNSVKSIGSDAFQYCYGLTSVTIPNSVTSIGDYAFHDCSGLTSVTIPNSVISIGGSAFEGCSGLTSVTIPNSVTSIAGFAFRGCSGLTSVTIPNSVTSIGGSAFRGCSRLTSVTIPNSVTSIGDEAFYECSGLTSVTIPNSVTSIGDEAFRYCSGLTSVTIPNSVTSIGDYAFEGCSGLTSVTILNSVTSIGDYAFSFCSGLTSVTIPNSVTSIAGSAFRGCSGLTSVTVDSDNPYYCSDDNVIYTKDKSTLVYCMTSKKGDFVIPNSVTSIGDYAFYKCSDLTSVTIPSSVTSIGGSAFEGCSGLTSVTIPNSVTSIGERAFFYCDNIKILHWDCNLQNSGHMPTSSLRELYIGDNVETIYFSTSSLQKVVLGKNVKYIRNNAFKGSKVLKEFYIIGTEVPYLYPDVFTDANLSNATLYAPKEKAAYYKTTEPWSLFGKVLDLEGNEPDTKKCETPTISFDAESNKIIVSSATDGAVINTTVSNSDCKTYTTNEIPLSGTFTITAYAKKEGYENSETATKQITLSAVEKIVEVEKEVEVFIYDDTHANIDLPTGERVTIEIREGIVTIKSLPINSTVYIYTEGGELWETRRVNSASLTLDLPRHSVYIIKTAGKTFKVKI